MLYYVKFLILSGDTSQAVFILSSLPNGIDHEPDFMLIYGLLMSMAVRLPLHSHT